MIYDTAIILAHELNRDRTLDRETRERTDLGIRYFKENKTKTLLMSGGHADFGECYGLSLARAMKDYAVANGVSENSIIEEDISLETAGQLIFCKIGVIEPEEWERILMISHDYHIPRVRIISNLVFGKKYNIEFIGVESGNNPERDLIEKERESTNIFLETFEGVITGDDGTLLNRLLKRHKTYNKSPEIFRERLASLRRGNSI